MANTGDAGDHTLLIDAVSIQPTNSEHLSILNAGFEASGPVDTIATADANVAGWNTSGSAESTVETVGGDDVPNGTFALQLNRESSISQSIGGLVFGERYELKFDIQSEDAELVVAFDEVAAHGLQISPGAENGYQKATHRFVAGRRNGKYSNRTGCRQC